MYGCISQETLGMIFLTGISLYFVGMLISWPIFYRKTVKGEMSMDDSPCETYMGAIIESFLASTIWFIFLIGMILENGAKINREVSP